MTGVRVAAVATQLIGVMWALLALVYAGGRGIPADFGVGIAVTFAGLLVWFAAGWWEGRR